MAIRLGPAQPRGMAWNGAGGWLILSQSRQVNFSRTVWITVHCRGMTSSLSVTSSPIFTMRADPQQVQAGGAATLKRDNGCLGGHRFGFGPVVTEIGLDVLKLHLQLLNQTGVAFGTVAILFTPEFANQPADAGRCVQRGLRQSIPSNRYPSCAAETGTEAPIWLTGQMNFDAVPERGVGSG
jgi:hypothetical protein